VRHGCYSVLCVLCVAVRLSVLQCAAVLECAVVCLQCDVYYVLQCVAVCCSVLQCVAVLECAAVRLQCDAHPA